MWQEHKPYTPNNSQHTHSLKNIKRRTLDRTETLGIATHFIHGLGNPSPSSNRSNNELSEPDSDADDGERGRGAIGT